MRRWLVALTLTAISTGSAWHVQWTPQTDQFALVVVTQCMEDGKLLFYVYDDFPLLDDNQDEAEVRRQHTPAGKRCTVSVQVVASGDSGLTEAVTDQSTVVIQED